MISRKFGLCGDNVSIGGGYSFAGTENFFIHNNVQIGRNALFWSTHAKLIIDNNVLIGPNVSIHTGNHDFSVIGKPIISVNIQDMDKTCFGDVVIKSDTWIGDGCIILKGVTIEKGCIIGAGSVVTRSTEPYGIYVGNPAKRIKNRFSPEEIIEHERILFSTFST